MEGKIKSSVQTLTCEPPFKDTSRPAKEAVAYLNLGSKTAEMQIQIWALPFSRFSSYLPSQPGIHFTLLNCCCLPFGPAFSLPYQINTAHSSQIHPLETKIWSFLSFDKKKTVVPTACDWQSCLPPFPTSEPEFLCPFDTFQLLWFVTTVLWGVLPFHPHFCTPPLSAL